MKWGSIFFDTWRRGQCWVGAEDEDPEHEDEFAEAEGLEPLADGVGVYGGEKGGEGADDVGAAVEHEQDAEDAGEKTRAVDEQAEGEEPESPEDFDDVEALAMQGEEEHGEGVAVGLVEDGEEVGTVDEDESGDGVEVVEKSEGDRDGEQSEHERGLAAADVFEEVVEGEGDPEEEDFAENVAGETDAEEGFVGGYVGRGCGCVAADDELVGDVDEGKEAWDRDEEIEQAYESSGVFRGLHRVLRRGADGLL
jgi:hypothetical protein